MIIYSSISTLTSIGLATAARVVEKFGPNNGSKNTGFVRYESDGDRDKFYGFINLSGW